MNKTDNGENTIKTLVIKGVFRSDDLIESLSLKGGNALDIVHNVSDRASRDFDFSMRGDIAGGENDEMFDMLERNISQTFQENGYTLFDFKVTQQPIASEGNHRTLEFWGGYVVSFKVILDSRLPENTRDIEKMRRNAEVIGAGKNIRLDISKFEYCESTVQKELDGYVIPVSSFEVIVAEKLRAACQQMATYRRFVHSYEGKGRARDLYDIHNLVSNFGLDVTSREFIRIICAVFEAKKVPMESLRRIEEVKELYRSDFHSLESVVRPNVRMRLKSFDYYFEFTSELACSIQSSWEKDLPLA